MIYTLVLCIILCFNLSLTKLIGNVSKARLKFNQRMVYSNAVANVPLEKEVEEAFTFDEDNTGHHILRALLYMGAGAIDKSHEIVQLLGVNGDAVYIHSLCHRLEGKYSGEGGLMGWSNADYWNDELGSHHLFPEIYSFSIGTSKEESYLSSARIKIFIKNLEHNKFWSPSLFLNLIIECFNQNDKIVYFLI